MYSNGAKNENIASGVTEDLYSPEELAQLWADEKVRGNIMLGNVPVRVSAITLRWYVGYTQEIGCGFSSADQMDFPGLSL
jgi:hypothetical protein